MHLCDPCERTLDLLALSNACCSRRCCRWIMKELRSFYSKRISEHTPPNGAALLPFHVRQKFYHLSSEYLFCGCANCKRLPPFAILRHDIYGAGAGLPPRHPGHVGGNDIGRVGGNFDFTTMEELGQSDWQVRTKPDRSVDFYIILMQTAMKGNSEELYSDRSRKADT